MKIKQEKQFKPITITLETREEAQAFIQMIDLMEDQVECSQLAIDISNWFTEESQGL